MTDRNEQIDRIIDYVGSQCEVGRKQILSKTKRRDIVRPRQIAMCLSRALTGESYTVIASHFGVSDHTTVMYADRLIPEMANEYEHYGRLVKKFYVELRAEFESVTA